MRFQSLDVIAPAFSGDAYSEAEVLGSAVWLWMHSSFHRDFPLHTLSTLLLPVLKRKQFVFASENGKPVFFMSWAEMNAEAESRYIRQPAVCIRDEDWQSGDRTWIIDWVAPFGHTGVTQRLLSHQLFINRCVRSLYHRGNGKRTRVMQMHGVAVLPLEARHWFATNPTA